ncbi:methyltransferase [Psychrobium sp. 1_MG-2023]|uniref:methyltransferase n=1 Tax=Psychrobium sp. 1_MG-2023 TaxID=3062624 RepID=UPI000C332B6F|nr:methyltransferase [Psychrobium sp. 1_MG-2023]MDP2560029.1 methyltransferase [Psychrobium sp. 1_MG-2023]PKF56309.1 23S rRNA (guanine(1835)-N(2))-methyltransferase [Alteromonadales bacterium alter-6D02]
MNILFKINDLELLLNRYPKSNDKNLQAWDSSDQYLLEYFKQHIEQSSTSQDPKTILIINDTFGTLACGLSHHKLFWQSDSFISHQACKTNLEDNQLTSQITFLDSLDALSDAPDVILLKLPKSNAMLKHQLQQIASIADQDTLIISTAKAKDIHSSTLSLFEHHIGTTTTSLAKKKSRLIFSQKEKTLQAAEPKVVQWPLAEYDFTIHNYAGVFANNQLDIGARLMLENIPEQLGDVFVIDLGCGNGVLGLAVAAKNPLATVRFTDESAMAIASAKLNCEQNIPQSEVEFDWNDCLSGYDYDQADLIVCNPPFHQLKTVTDHIAWQMFNDAYRTLKRGGKLRIVGNRHLGYHIKLQRLFGNCITVAANNKFVILEATK